MDSDDNDNRPKGPKYAGHFKMSDELTPERFEEVVSILQMLRDGPISSVIDIAERLSDAKSGGGVLFFDKAAIDLCMQLVRSAASILEKDSKAGQACLEVDKTLKDLTAVVVQAEKENEDKAGPKDANLYPFLMGKGPKEIQ